MLLTLFKSIQPPFGSDSFTDYQVSVALLYLKHLFSRMPHNFLDTTSVHAHPSGTRNSSYVLLHFDGKDFIKKRQNCLFI